MQKIFEELIVEASTGRVIIDDEEWPITFNTKILDEEKDYENEENFSTLIIKDEERFLKLLRKYISIELKKNRKMPKFYKDISRNKIKWLMAYLFVNARCEDFDDPEEYLRRVIGFLEDNTFDYLSNGIEIDAGSYLLDSKLKVQKNISSTSMETPNKIDLTLTKEINNKTVEYNLPSIYYGIDKGVCYIYSIITPKSKKDKSEEEIKYNKQINRVLYKLNNGITDTKEYIDYKEGKSTYYPEGNITDVTHSFILSLSIFLSLLKSRNITKVKAVPYLPVRYASRYITAKRNKDKNREKELLDRNNDIQNNTTNKFLRTFLRLSSQDKSISIESYPYEIDEFLTVNLSNKQKEVTNELLKDVKMKLKERI